MGKFNSFEIIYEQPQGVIHSGGQISGKVIIDVKEEVKLRGIRIIFDGSAYVHWSRKSGKTRRHYYKSEEYLKYSITLWGQGPDDKGDENPVLNPGHYEFPFSTVIPVTAPSSFEGITGYVRYFCKAVADRPWRFDYTTKNPFTVSSHYDLNAQPTAVNSAREENEKTICCFCCKSGPIKCSASIPRIGYVPGESIPFTAEVINNSRRSVSSTKVSLKQYLTFYSTSSSITKSEKIFEAARGRIEAGNCDSWSNFPIPIPPIPASELAGCSIIDIAYKLKFEVSPSGMATNFDVHLPIIIGTIPLRSFISAYLPTAPYPSAPEGSQLYPDIPPPSYQDSMFGASDIRDDSDNQYTMGQLSYTPLYPTYKFD